MGDNATRTTKCRVPDQWVDLDYQYDDLEQNPVANMPFQVTCQRDRSIVVKGTTDANGKAHVTGLIPGPVDVLFQPDSDAQARLDAANLRKEFKATLDGIITGIETDAGYQQALLKDMNLAEKGLVYSGAFLHGVWEGATGFVDFIKLVGPILVEMDLEMLDIQKCIVTGDVDALEQKMRDAKASGKKIADATQEILEKLFLLLSDPDIRQLLYEFPERYWDAHSSVDQTHMAGSMGSDLIVAILIGALTGGAGTAATVGKIAARGGALAQKAMAQLNDLAKAMKKIKPKMKFNGHTKGTVKAKVPKTRPNKPVNPAHHSDAKAPGKNANGDVCSPISKTPCSHDPISMITGEELLEQTDFVIPGLIPLAWKRVYRTSNDRNRGLGHGWTHSACETLQIGNDVIIHEDAEGRRIEFPVPDIGQFSSNSAEGMFLHRDWHTVFYLKQPGRPDKLFLGRNTLKLRALIDPVGNRWDFFFDEENGALTALESTWGTRLQVDTDQHGMIERISQFHPLQLTQPLADQSPATAHTLVRYHYSAERDLIAVDDAGGDPEQFAYHNHILTRRTLRTGFSFQFEWDQYNPRAKCLHAWGDNGHYDYRFEWDTTHRISRSTDSNGGVLELHYNEQGLKTRETEPAGNTTTYEYDSAGRLSKKTDALGFEHTYFYDDIGNLTAQLDPSGGGFSLLYDDQYRLTEYSDALGNTWAREYNPQGLVSTTTDAEGHQTRYYYNDQGQPEIIIDPTGAKRLLAWGPNGKLLQQVHDQGEPVHYHYDTSGQVAAVEQAGRTTCYDYNRKGDITAIHHPDGSSARLAYNANRQLTAFTDPLGRTTRFDYDGLAQITRRTDPAGHTLHYHYDRERNLIGLTNENGEHYQLKYDANERLIEETGFDGRVQQYEYNPLGHLVAHIEGRYDLDGIASAIDAASSESERARLLQQQAQLENQRAAHTTRFERDPLGRLLQKITPDGDNTVYSYDRTGRLNSAINRARSLGFEYSPNGHLQAEIQGLHRIEHTYDPLGNRTGTTLPGGQQLGYEYNHQGLFTALDFNGQRLTQLQRNSLGQELTRSQGDIHSGYDYDPAGRLTRQWAQHHNTQHAVIDRHYHYDAAGRLNGIDDLRKGPTRYVYDQLDRLKAVEGYASEQFEFDPAGNILSPQGSATSAATAQQKPANVATGNRLQFHGDRHFSYDSRGNLTEEKRGTGGKLQTKYTYNSQNQLIQVEKGNQTFTYAYDPLGRRVRKADAFGETEFLYNGDVLLSEKRNHHEKLYLYEPASFKPLAFIENNQCYFYHLDHLGTPQELTDWEGKIVWSARYRVYGNVLAQDVATVENNLRFQGQYFDEETGLHYNRFRYYDPGTGQFTTQDPIGLLGGVNNYQYAPNAVGWVDPLGLTCKENTWNEFQKDTQGQFSSSSEAAEVYKRNKLAKQGVNPASIGAEAQGWQGKGSYHGVDKYDDVVIPEDTIIWGGAPGQGNYYTTQATMDMHGNDSTAIFQSLQVGPYKGTYRPGMTAYRVKSDLPAAYGNVSANPQFGPGGADQFYIPDFKDHLEPLYSVPLTNTKVK